MTEEYTSPDESMWLLLSQFGYLSFHLLCHGEATELNEKLLVINSLVSCRLDLKGRYEIFLLDLILFAVLLLSLG